MKKFMTRSALLLALSMAMVGCGQGNQDAASNTSVAESVSEEVSTAESSEAASETATASDSKGLSDLKATLTEEKDGVLVGDGEDGEKIYFVQNEMDEHGWAATGMIAVKDGKITKSNFDYLNEEGKLKSEDQDYISSMKEKSGKDISEAIQYYDSFLTTSTDLTQIPADVKTGATDTANVFEEMANKLLTAAELN